MNGTRLISGVIATLWLIIAGIFLLANFGLWSLIVAKTVTYPVILEWIFLETVPVATLDTLLLWSGLTVILGSALALTLFAATLHVWGRFSTIDTFRFSAMSALTLLLLVAITLLSFVGGETWLQGLPTSAIPAPQSTPIDTETSAVSRPPAPAAISAATCPTGDPTLVDFCIRLGLYILPSVSVLRLVLWVLAGASAIIAALSASAFNHETRDLRATPPQWNRLLPTQNGVCTSCGSAIICAFCRAKTGLTIRFVTDTPVEAAPVFKRGERVRVRFALPHREIQRSAEWLALFMPSGMALASAIPLDWQQVAPNTIRQLLRSSTQQQLPSLLITPKTAETQREFDLEFVFKDTRKQSTSVVAVEYYEVNPQSDARRLNVEKRAPEVKTLRFDLEAPPAGPSLLGTLMKRLQPTVIVILMALLLGIGQSAYAQDTDCENQNCLDLFSGNSLQIEYQVRGSIFMNPLLELVITQSTSENLRGRLPQDNFVLLVHNNYCTLIVAALVDPDAPDSTIAYVDVPAGITEPIRVFAHAFCLELNFGAQASGNPFPPPEQRYVYPSRSDPMTGKLPAKPELVTTNFEENYRDFRSIFDKAADQTCAAPINLADFAPPAPMPEAESAAQCVAQVLAIETDNGIATETAEPLSTSSDRQLNFKDLTTQIAVFIAYTGAENTSRVWDTYVNRLNNAVFLRDYPSLYCLLDMEEPPLTPRLDLPTTAETPLLTPLQTEAVPGGLYYRLQVAQFADDNAPPTLLRDELISGAPNFTDLELRAVGEYAVCYSVIGTNYTYDTSGEIIIARPPETAAQRVGITASTVATPEPPPRAGDALSTAVVELPIIGFTPLAQVALGSFGLILGIVVSIIVVPSFLRAQGARISSLILMLLIALVVGSLIVLLTFVIPVVIQLLRGGV